jgi:flagellar hook-associated protein 3 FlgL
MSISAVNLARVSLNLRTQNLLQALQRTQLGLYGVQNQLSTGLRFTQPSQDPVGATHALTLQRRLGQIQQVKTNLGQVEAVANEADSAMQDALSLATEAHTLAIQSVGDTLSPEERRALVPVVDAQLSQMVTLANRRHLNTYLFSGQETGAPFTLDLGGVVYNGNGNPQSALVDTDGTQEAFTVPGVDFFGAGATTVLGTVDLDPALTLDTRIVDLDGAQGRGVELGRIRLSRPSGDVDVDLRGSATVGDLVDKLNAGLPADLRASLGARGITIRSVGGTGQQVIVREVEGGRTAGDLGLLGTFTDARDGDPLQPRLTTRTPLSALGGGLGLDLSGGLVIRNGGQSATIALDDAQTMEEVLQRINSAGVGAWARIADDGQHLEIRSRVAGTNFSIEENGGQAATALGLRTLCAGTKLSALNGGQGVATVTGGDLRVTTSDGTVIDVSLAGATTLQGVLDRINAAGGNALQATLADQGNGLVLTDTTLGAGTFTVAALNDSPAVHDLGLDGAVAGSVLTGRDVNLQRADSPFTALLELRDALQRDDGTTLVVAGERLDRVLKQMQVVQGRMASQARSLADRSTRVDAEADGTKSLISDVQDVDFTEAAVRFQQLQTALQANLSVAARVTNMSVLDYLPL